MAGQCVTAEECGNNGGTAAGNCASGFGVCCSYVADSTGSQDVTQNIAHIQNPGFPSTINTATGAFTYNIKPKRATGVCQVRLDFINGVLVNPTNNLCTGAAQDQLTVSSGGSGSFVGFNSLCGTLTGQHMYLDTGRQESAATVTVTFGTATSGRSWKIKVTCLDCESENLADNGCLQWYTSHSGRIRSFNSQNAMIHNQQYSICIKQEEGMCAFELSETQTTNTPRAFALDATNTAAKQTGATCAQHMIIVKGTSATASDDVFCGGRLSETSAQTTSGTIRSDRTPFQIGVVATQGDATAIAQANSLGFDLQYRQVPCQFD